MGELRFPPDSVATEGTDLAENQYSTRSGLPKVLWISASFHGKKKEKKNQPKIKKDKTKAIESIITASLSSADVVSDGNSSEVQKEQPKSEPKVKQISIPEQ